MRDSLTVENVWSTHRQYQWKPFRLGIEAHVLYGEPGNGPSAAYLKYAPGASTPEHFHTGYEHVLILEGKQVDARGEYAAGTLVINPPGTRHRVFSPAGCIVLIIWEKPIAVVEP